MCACLRACVCVCVCARARARPSVCVCSACVLTKMDITNNERYKAFAEWSAYEALRLAFCSSLQSALRVFTPVSAINTITANIVLTAVSILVKILCLK